MTGKNINFILVITFCVSVVSCSKPESDGKKAAEKFCDCEQTTIETRQKEYSDLANNFDSYNFQTRVAVREKIQEIEDKTDEQNRNCMQEAQQNYQKVIAQYIGNYAKSTQFENAYQSYINANQPTAGVVSSLYSQIETRILSIIPSKPDAEKMKQDLVGQKLTFQKYTNRQGREWTVQSTDEVQNLQIVSAEERGSRIVYDLKIDLRNEMREYEADAIITYFLGNQDDWKIENIHTKRLETKITNIYKDCITAQLDYDGNIVMRNSCSVALLVEGMALKKNDDTWGPFEKVVDANSVATEGLGGFLTMGYRNFVIQKTERP